MILEILVFSTQGFVFGVITFIVGIIGLIIFNYCVVEPYFCNLFTSELINIIFPNFYIIGINGYDILAISLISFIIPVLVVYLTTIFTLKKNTIDIINDR